MGNDEQEHYAMTVNRSLKQKPQTEAYWGRLIRADSSG